MEYKNLLIEEDKNGLLVQNVTDFIPEHVFECGQCFRWKKQKGGKYNGIAYKKEITVSKQEDDALYLEGCNMDDFINIWYDYFDLGTDYGRIKETVNTDEIMNEAIKYGSGIRILKQDFYETVISFIISANNMIPRISKTIEEMSVIWGEKNTKSQRASFPEVLSLAEAEMESLEKTGAGFRCKYIKSTSQFLRGNTEKFYTTLKSLPTDQARKKLMELPGVGPKVADCTMLFSGIATDIFPVDVWVKKIMEELYIKREAKIPEIWDMAYKKYNKLMGYAQQYLFYYARNNLK